MSKAEENVETVKKGFAAYDAGDLETVINMWHPDVLYHGFNAAGEREEFKGRDAFFAMLMEVSGKLEVNKNEVLSVHPIGEEMVVCHIRATRRAKGDTEDTVFEFVMVLRLEDGQAIHGTDMIDSKAEVFWRNLATSAG